MRTLTKDVPQHVGETITLKGWVHGRRDHGRLIFIDLRDRWGIVQVVFTPGNKELLAKANMIRPEWVIELEGLVKERPAGMQNKDLATGSIEIEASRLEILSEAQTSPFAIDTDGYEIGEEHRIEYRYLDLRRERMKKNLMLRDKVISFVRNFLHEKDFIEVETPILTKSTPEGARDYVVPSRIYSGNFYALPQSPQQYKQLLMVAGIDKYFQIARCFRDEDTRGDRQPEFTQLDIEMSFIEREDVLAIIENLLIDLVNTVVPEKKIQQIPFPRVTYKEAMEKHGTDRPDLRVNKDDPNEFAFCWVLDFPVFEKGEHPGAWTYSHNPFTAPKSEFLDDLLQEKNLESILSQQYDIVLNGYEIGGGGIRIHSAETLKKVFSILGHSDGQIQEGFSHMLHALSSGAPPHGGMAWGLDRIVMLLAGEPNIREVIAFPKTGDARDLMMKSPAEIPEKHLQELGLKVIKK